MNQAEETSIFNSFFLFYYYSLQSLDDKHKTSLLIHSQSKPQVHSIINSIFFVSFKIFTLHCSFTHVTGTCIMGYLTRIKKLMPSSGLFHNCHIRSLTQGVWVEHKGHGASVWISWPSKALQECGKGRYVHTTGADFHATYLCQPCAKTHHDGPARRWDRRQPLLGKDLKVSPSLSASWKQKEEGTW